MNSAHRTLKSETQALHRRLESHPLQRLLLSPSLNKRSLQRILQAYLGFYLPLEMKLVNSVPCIYPTYGFQSTEILMDLIVLQSDMQNLILCEKLPIIASNYDALGAFYVLEGARLGGMVINQHLKSVLPSLQTRFFASRSHSLVNNWTDFVSLLDVTVVTTSQCNSVVNKAQETFTCFELWLDAIDSAHSDE